MLLLYIVKDEYCEAEYRNSYMTMKYFKPNLDQHGMIHQKPFYVAAVFSHSAFLCLSVGKLRILPTTIDRPLTNEGQNFYEFTSRSTLYFHVIFQQIDEFRGIFWKVEPLYCTYDT